MKTAISSSTPLRKTYLQAGLQKAILICGHVGDDTLEGGGGRNVISSGPGDDTMVAAQDGDVLFGGRGDDVIKGGIGNDLMIIGGQRPAISLRSSSVADGT